MADQVPTGELHGSLSEIEYKILNNPAQMHLMPVFENEELITPHYNYTTYPSGYFTPRIVNNQIVDDTTPWLTATTHQDYLNKEEFKYGYCIENSNKKPLKSTSTMLLIQAKFTPTVWVNADGTVSGTNPDGTKGIPGENGTFYRIGHYSSTGFLYAYLQGYYNEYPDPVLAELGQPLATQGGGYYQADQYPEGKTYYGFWPVNANGLHHTKRNNYFKIAITHVHGAGYKEPGDTVDPDIDPDDLATRGRLAVNIESWIDEKVIVTLGQEPEENPDINTGIEDWNEEDQEENLGSGDEINLIKQTTSIQMEKITTYKKITGIFICLFLFVCSGCIHETLDPCEEDDFETCIRFNFLYDYNMEERDLFAEQVDHITLIIYSKESGELEQIVEVHRQDMEENHTISLMLSPGDHTAVAWGNIHTEHYSLHSHETTANHLLEMTCIDKQTMTTTRANPGSLFHASHTFTVVAGNEEPIPMKMKKIQTR